MLNRVEESPQPQRNAMSGRKKNPEKTKNDILLAAVAEFAEQGLTGARVDAIAERTNTSKRMIYYYFGSKDQLYMAALEKLYSDIRCTEAELHLGELPPVEAIRRLIEFTFDHREANVNFIRVVSIENIHFGEFAARSKSITELNRSIVTQIGEIIDRGVESGDFRPGLDPLDLHLMISAFCFFRIANRHTFGAVYQVDLLSAENRARHREMICEAVLRYIRP